MYKFLLIFLLFNTSINSMNMDSDELDLNYQIPEIGQLEEDDNKPNSINDAVSDPYPQIELPEDIADEPSIQAKPRKKPSVASRKHLRPSRRKVQCPICSKMLARADGLRRHLKDVHSGKKNYACEECDKHYSEQSSLYKHNKKYHRNLN
jgi:hypothetical protein